MWALGARLYPLGGQVPRSQPSLQLACPREPVGGATGPQRPLLPCCPQSADTCLQKTGLHSLPPSLDEAWLSHPHLTLTSQGP